MINTIGPNAYEVLSKHSNSSLSISSLASSTTCGLIMLVNKLIVQWKGNAATKQLIHHLINRIHPHCIVIRPSINDDPETFIFQMIEKASEFSFSNSGCRTSVEISATLLIKTLMAHERDQVDFLTLEYYWKDFAFHFYRSKLSGL